MNISTYTLIARDEKTGRICIAGGTNWFCYGRWVPHIKAGVGAVATQAETNMEYPEICFELLSDGLDVKTVMEKTLIREPDEGGIYQFTIMDKEGNTQAYTGKHNHVYAGSIAEKNVVVAGNTLVDEKTLEAVVKYFRESKEEFGLKVIRSLQAGQIAGGDIRGMKSSAFKMVGTISSGKDWQDLLFDLRVDESKDPLKELERIYVVANAYNEIIEAEESDDLDVAMKHYEKALELDPENTEVKFWMARILKSQNNNEKSDVLMKEICLINPYWEEFGKRLDRRKAK